ncbi:hypothetical protein POSPLADRAFT_1169563 [Postia placenta MAD-698-R-SB12]|uniref:UDENN domain-containing protein n=1 Tax=Postia placenta MAD-698-R-SB12 TaxID=670580 RepID=A0A1X6N2X8_9APHY|nr:hypothetical protein POSPLADRAFT_1169563 [Postia placenta MAD-698-R-SB12]OSX62954.1 hypothetical protein POSPLADRAFT_1169563 [Postia placenta MAD-698-R-SB12]
MQATDAKGRAPQDVVAIFHAAFHPTQGNVLDWSLKASEDLDLSHVEFSALPSGLHLMERDVIYFTKDEHAGVCVFHRQHTTEQGHRGFRLSSLGILLAKSARPRPWLHVAALKELFRSIYSSIENRDVLIPVDGDWDPARAFFEERKVRRSDLGGAGDWRGWDTELENDVPDMDPTIHLPHLLRILGPSSLTLYKHVLGRRRILIYTLPPVEAACILCQVAADICYQYQASGEAALPRDSDNEDSSPKLKGKSTEGVKVLGMITLSDLPKLEQESKTGRGWVACTTDALFLEKPQYYDLLIDLRTSTPNTRPTFYASKLAEPSNGRGPSHRLSIVRFTWSDVKLWTELDRLLQLDASTHTDVCCDPSSSSTSGRSRASANSWTDIWRVYEDVCVMCAGLWMGSWRAHPTLACSPGGARWENWGSIRLEGADELAPPRKTPYVRTVGMGIEGRVSLPSSSSRSLRKASGIAMWTWPGRGGDAPEPPLDETAGPATKDTASVTYLDDTSRSARRARQVLTTLALLHTFHANTVVMLARLGELLPQRRAGSQQENSSVVETVLLTPKDVMSFELGPFSGLDARFVEWLGDEYGGGVKVVVRRSWRDLVGLILGFG